jgi:hypothetical protein
VNAFKREARFVFLVDGLNLDFGCSGNQRADHDSGAIAERMHAEQLMRGTLIDIDQAPQFFRGE